MPDYVWRPIEPLAEAEKGMDLAVMGPRYESWRSSKKRIQKSSPGSLKDFNQRLVRQLSVETGILERLYDLDRGTTEARIANGFVEELVTRSNTNIEPATLIDILRDQEAAIELVIDWVAKNRELSIGLIHKLPGGSDHDSGHWYRYEVASSAKAAGKFVNFAENTISSRRRFVPTANDWFSSSRSTTSDGS